MDHNAGHKSSATLHLESSDMISRSDNRTPEQVRPVNIIPDFISTAEGSALIEMGNTRVICAASAWRCESGSMESIGVSKVPGAIVITRICIRARSRAVYSPISLRNSSSASPPASVLPTSGAGWASTRAWRWSTSRR